VKTATTRKPGELDHHQRHFANMVEMARKSTTNNPKTTAAQAYAPMMTPAGSASQGKRRIIFAVNRD